MRKRSALSSVVLAQALVHGAVTAVTDALEVIGDAIRGAEEYRKGEGWRLREIRILRTKLAVRKAVIQTLREDIRSLKVLARDYTRLHREEARVEVEI